jgi:dipeptidyl aminopeptidase/acylaminoacyl peptidase
MLGLDRGRDGGLEIKANMEVGHSGRARARCEDGGVVRASARRERHHRSWLTWLLPLLALMSFDASALRKLAPGKAIALEANEGLLVVSIDSSTPLRSVRFERVGALFSSSQLSRVEAGLTRQVYAVPAGDYQWSMVTLVDTWTWRSVLELGDDEEFRFSVRAGQITYAGDLIVRPTSWRSAGVHIANRSLPVIDWLRDAHGALYARYPFEYSGYYPDPFPAFYRRRIEAGAVVPADPDGGLDPPAAGNLALPTAVMFAPTRVADVVVSPDGALIAQQLRTGEAAWQIDVIDIVSGTLQVLARSEYPFDALAWESDAILLATLPRANDQLHAFVVDPPVNGARNVHHLRGPSGGRVVDLLPEERGAVLYERVDRTGKLAVHRLPITSQKAFSSFEDLSPRRRLNKGVENDLVWFTDGDGALRMALARRGEDLVLVHGRDGAFRDVMVLDDDGGFMPSALSWDGGLIYGLSDSGRAQRDLVELDPAQGRVTRTLFSKPSVDVARGLFDSLRRPIGVVYYEGGRAVSEYFDDGHRAFEAQLQAAFPDRTAMVIGRSRDDRRLLLSVDASDVPPQLYYLEVADRRAELLGDMRPELAGRRFVPSRLIRVARREGPPIDAFLTLPPVAGKAPLVVFAHGGPSGVADRLHFDREVQFIASLGYAVLQVNFRGSEGYGRAFREAARHQHGAGIEDDIDAALGQALADYPLDSTRMCMFGASYGGYSALISAIRWPGRFRCVVSMAGVTDRALFFTASDGARSVQGREALERWVGDPEKDLDAMIASSPLYQVDHLDTPVMLLHGRDDLRVDLEHTRRLVRLLNMADRKPVLMLFDDAGHGLVETEQLVNAWDGIAGFLRHHLDAPPRAAPD